MMAKAIRRNPRKETVGPTTILRVLNMSGLKPPSTVVPGPDISMKPRIIMARDAAISRKLILSKGRSDESIFWSPELSFVFLAIYIFVENLNCHLKSSS